MQDKFAMYARMKKVTAKDVASYKPGTQTILKAALALKVSVYRFFDQERVFILKKGNKTVWVRGPRLSVSNPVSLWIIKDKFLTKEALENVGVPYPKGFSVRSVSEAVLAAKEIGLPLVMKPRSFEGGKGVFLNVDSIKKVKKFFPMSAQYDRSKEVVLEKEVFGTYYRITMVGRKIVGALETKGIQLIGDGKRNVQELIGEYNTGREKKYVIAKKTKDILLFQNLTLQAVPKKGVEFILGFSGSEGGEWIDRTDKVCRENRALFAKLASYLDLNVSGIDLIAKDIALPITSKKSPGYVLEINGAPEFMFHMNPTSGKARDIGKAIIAMLFKK